MYFLEIYSEIDLMFNWKAEPVWQYYISNRPTGVEWKQFVSGGQLIHSMIDSSVLRLNT